MRYTYGLWVRESVGIRMLVRVVLYWRIILTRACIFHRYTACMYHTSSRASSDNFTVKNLNSPSFLTGTFWSTEKRSAFWSVWSNSPWLVSWRSFTMYAPVFSACSGARITRLPCTHEVANRNTSNNVPVIPFIITAEQRWRKRGGKGGRGRLPSQYLYVWWASPPKDDLPLIIRRC